MQLPDEYVARLERLEKLRDQGIDPYPANVERSHTVAEFLAQFDQLISGGLASGAPEARPPLIVNIVGRVRSLRPHGGSTFAHIEDGTGPVQLFFQRDTLGADAYNQLFATLDVGDFIIASGVPYTTRRGEKSLQIRRASIISKALLPLPEKWHGLTDVEVRYRRRYLDLIMNDSVREIFRKRSLMLTKLREYMDGRGYLEVQTPILQPIYGGGFAQPFKTHHNALDINMYLRISNEMYLKRLIVGGFERVYEISVDFRNEGIDYKHNPEFTIMEAMAAYENYFYGMDIIEELTEFLARETLGITTLEYEGKKIELKRPWGRMAMTEAIREALRLDVEKMDIRALIAECKRHKIETQKIKTAQSWGELVALIFEEKVEATLIQPTFIYNFPVEVSPLAKKCPGDPRFAERFEQFINGWEIGNNYNEINDPLDLQRRFIEEGKREKTGFAKAHQTDEDYVEAIMHGMPPTVGIATSIDRLVMLFTGAHSIKEVILFPTLRPEGTRGGNAGKSKETIVAHAVILDTPDIPTWSKLNTAAHLSAALAAREGMKLIHMEGSTTKDGEKIPMNIQHAIMMKTTSRRADLLTLKHEAEAQGLTVTCFTEEMQSSTDDKKVKAKQEVKDADEIGFMGVLVFGPKKSVESLTEKFPLSQ